MSGESVRVGWRLGEDNPNWRGGRVLASNGYILVRVGRTHHLADVRGYAYEHRLVAEEMLGRRLEVGELVHHRNGIKTDNRPENLEVLPGNAEHFYLHRKTERGLRKPSEANPETLCACGCGTPLLKYDECGRPRRYISGHNPMPAPTEESILNVLRSVECASRQVLVNQTGKSIDVIGTTLSKLKRKHLVFQVSRGVWAATQEWR